MIIWHSKRTGNTTGWIDFRSLQEAGLVGRKEGDQTVSRGKAGNMDDDVGAKNINEKK